MGAIYCFICPYLVLFLTHFFLLFCCPTFITNFNLFTRSLVTKTAGKTSRSTYNNQVYLLVGPTGARGFVIQRNRLIWFFHILTGIQAYDTPNSNVKKTKNRSISYFDFFSYEISSCLLFIYPIHPSTSILNFPKCRYPPSLPDFDFHRQPN